MIVVLPTSLMAQESARGMLHSDGGVWLNGVPAPNSAAIFPNDLVQTQKETKATINAEGSAATVQPDTIVQFDEEDELFLDHGGLEVNTSRGMRVRVNCLTVTPVTQDWTRYSVIDVDGRMMVVAYQNDVKIHYQGAAARQSKSAVFSDVTVHQGEQLTRDERCGAPSRPAQVVNANGAILNSAWAKAGGALALGLICLGVCHGDDPVSPSKP